MIIVSDSTIASSDVSGVDVDFTNPVHVAYGAAAVVGGTAIVGSVAVTAIAAPGFVLVPAAIAAGCCAYAHIENDRRSQSDDATETAAA